MSDAKGSAAYVAAIERLKKLCGDDYKPRDVVIDEVAALQADNARLRALVKSAEKGTAAFTMCPWCEMEGGGHFESCPAFTADGVVK